ncbi:luminal-binding protein-like, partial [Lolium rigidum]|uniref:luminal-binding protein-like n=1 Tax=Lolium rigidum TaxID=89674 RepID=UPI001F5D64A0
RSWVAFNNNGTLFGQAALKHAAVSPGTAVSGFKRLMGLGMHNAVVKREMELVPYKLFRTPYGTPGIQIQAEGGDARNFQTEEVDGILMGTTSDALTAPVRFTADQKHSLMAHARWDGGFSATRSVGEYVAAAAAYGLHEKPRHGKVILVFHMGGRTTHATRFKFRYRDGLAHHLGASYEAQLGGADLTGRVVDHFVELIKEKHHRDIRQDESALRKLWAACEIAKKTLSHREDAVVKAESVLDDGADFFARLTRAQFEELNGDLLARAVGTVERAVTWPAPPDQWESRKESVDAIILVGGSVRIPKIAQFFRDYFHGREAIVEEEAVIRGAAHLSRRESADFTLQCADYYSDYFGC